MKANEVIRMRRKELGMTLKEVANAVGAGKGSDRCLEGIGRISANRVNVDDRKESPENGNSGCAVRLPALQAFRST